MSKVLKIGALALIAFALPFAAGAVSLPGFYDAIFDGQDEVTVAANGSIDVQAFLEIPAGEVIYAASTDVIGPDDHLSRECHTFSPIQGAQSVTREFTHDKVTSNTGDYGFRINVYTADDVNEANALKNVGDGCNGDFDPVYNQNDVVHVVPSGTSVGSEGSTSLASLAADVNRLAAIVACVVQGKVYNETTKQCVSATTSTPTPTGKCAELSTKMQGTANGQTQAWDGSPNSRLQGFLLSEGQSIPWLAKGAAFGFFGPQTNEALSKFKQANQCGA